MTSRYDLPHIDLNDRKSRVAYKSEGAPIDKPPRNRVAHGGKLRGDLQSAFKAFNEARPRDPRVEPVNGAFLEVELRRGSVIDDLERKTDGVKPLAVQLDAAERRIVGLFVPDEARPILDQILQDYQTGPLTEVAQNPPKKGFVEPIESFRQARLETFWTDDPEFLPTDPSQFIWWEVWCMKSAEAELEQLAETLEARCAAADHRLEFPEHIVIPVYATRTMIEIMLFGRFAIMELRRATDNPTFFLDTLDTDERITWTQDLAERVQWPGADAPSVCLFDTGVNRAHHLIEPALAPNELDSVVRVWGVDDTGPFPGHGTQMAGLALHGDLTYRLASALPYTLTHRLESIKILPPPGAEVTEERFYGSITKSAVSIAEVNHPTRRRVFCMAVTNEGVSGAQPTTWSAAIDQEASGVTFGDESAPKRLFIISAGNAPNPIMMRDVQPLDTLPIEDPAQAWNAIVVGGYTDKIDIQEPDLADHTPMADAGELSPFTRTSTLWTKGRAPYKPDIVMEAGNRAVDPMQQTVVDTTSLSVLTSGPDVGANPLVAFRATSAATAEAARLAARLMAAKPDYWPETIRALMVHGAEWTNKMRFALDPLGKTDAAALLRHFGYGVPTYERAVASAENHLALVAQSEIQPYTSVGGRSFNDCHYYDLPWPSAALETLGDEEVKLKISLSYFVEPNPGALSTLDAYRYQSFGLRFDLKRRNETTTNFKKRVNVAERADKFDKPPTSSDDGNWLFGPDSVSCGSLHCDEWSGPAAHLLTRDLLCIKPVGGWWRGRADIKICNKMARYALVVSLKTDSQEVTFHTDISAIINGPIPIEAEIDILF
jgi:hypothetical protein